MSQLNDEEEREILLKRQKRHEDITMKGSVNLQHVAELLKKQQQRQQKQRDKNVSSVQCKTTNFFKARKYIRWAGTPKMAKKGTTILSPRGSKIIDTQGGTKFA